MATATSPPSGWHEILNTTPDANEFVRRLQRAYDVLRQSYINQYDGVELRQWWKKMTPRAVDVGGSTVYLHSLRAYSRDAGDIVAFFFVRVHKEGLAYVMTAGADAAVGDGDLRNELLSIARHVNGTYGLDVDIMSASTSPPFAHANLTNVFAAAKNPPQSPGDPPQLLQNEREVDAKPIWTADTGWTFVFPPSP